MAHVDPLAAILADLFAVFPLRSVTEQDRKERTRQFHLYCDHLADLPLAHVRAAVVKLIRAAKYLPRISEIRAHVRERMSQDAAQFDPIDKQLDNGERAHQAQTLRDIYERTRGHSQPVVGPCQRAGCVHDYEYTADQAALLRSTGAPLLCGRCMSQRLATRAVP